MSALSFQKIIAANIILLLTTFFFPIRLHAQEVPTQVIRGTVVDAFTKTPIEGASLVLRGGQSMKSCRSDSLGRFRLEEVVVGRYTLDLSHLAYVSLEVPELLVESGKELILELLLEEKAANLQEVVVAGQRWRGSPLSTVSTQRITVEEVQRLPATFDDPARLIGSYAGVVNVHDGANHISVRGNSPNSTAWRLEGGEIVNPNHLADAGTSGNRPAATGGGVNLLSAQMLDYATLYSGAFPADYGNALGGIMDMYFRQGNDEKHFFTMQAGLIGFDISAEGPLSKEKGISYLFNYRYSFVGLLSALGVDFGGESIAFQDFSFHVKVPLAQKSLLKIYGMGGLSKNIFTGQSDSTQWQIDKDRFNIHFTNQMTALGASLHQAINKESTLKITALHSTSDTRKRNDLYMPDGTLRQAWAYDSLSYSKTTFAASFHYKLSKKHRFRFGSTAVNHRFGVETFYTDSYAHGRDGGLLLGNYAEWTWRLYAPLEVQAALHHSFFSFSRQSSWEPRAALHWRCSDEARIHFAYGLYSQTQLPQIYLATDADGNYLNKNLGFTKSHHFVLAYDKKVGKQSEWRVELFYQSLFQVPIVEDSSSLQAANYSIINLLSDYSSLPLVNKGRGRNYGVEASWRRFMENDFYYLFNGTWYRSLYQGYDGKWRSSRFDGKYAFGLMLGKEFSWRKKGKKKILGVHLGIAYAGGLRSLPINEALSAMTDLATVRDHRAAFSKKRKDYFRTDFRFYLKNNKAKYSSTFSIDLQNLSNTRNDGFLYFDHSQQKIIPEKQLGLTPNMSYRLAF